MLTKTVWVDLTQFLSDPAKTGIQRVLAQLILEWKKASLDFEFFSIENGNIRIFTKNEIVGIFEELFSTDLNYTYLKIENLQYHSMAKSQFLKVAEILLLPELTYKVDSFELISTFKKNRKNVVSIVYDLLPATNPEFFPQSSLAFDQYLNAIENSRFICISKKVSKDLKNYFNLNYLPNYHHLGLDHIEISDSLYMDGEKIFDVVLLGTVEPRKFQVEILLELQNIDKNLRIVVLGKLGWLDDQNLELFYEIIKNPKILHIDHFSDLQSSYFLSSSKFSIFWGPEGWCLPALECIKHGVNIISDGRQPALTELNSLGVNFVAELSEIRNIISRDGHVEQPISKNVQNSISNLTWRSFADFVHTQCMLG
jgi:hypothetical protein